MSQKEKYKLEYSIKLFEDAIKRLDEALKAKIEGENSLIVDASIQRFEFVFEMSWKTLKRFLDYKGVIAKTPRDCFKQAFKLGWISNDDLWIQMIEDRNKTSHTYNRKIATEVYSHLSEYLNSYQDLLATLHTQL